jgi:hypothetical protein
VLVHEDFVGWDRASLTDVDLLELVLGAGVAIRVELFGLLAEGFFDHDRRGADGDVWVIIGLPNA